ncbi:hypothetical protein DFH28DRAFT_935401 [Melampsora americana]|nr:hypothetical protein DFH28DRAFT_935401 [Melampsora americana]
MTSNLNHEDELEARRIRENNLNATLKGRKTRASKKTANLPEQSKESNEDFRGNEDAEINNPENITINSDINMDDGDESGSENRRQRVATPLEDDKSSSDDSSSGDEKENKNLVAKAQRALAEGKHAKAAEILAKMTEVETNIKSGKKDLLPDNPLVYTGEVSTSHLKTFTYAAGKERERFNPINGRKYLYGKNHNSTEGLNIVDQTNLTIPENKGYQGNRRNNKGKGFNRSVSPYQKPEDRDKETIFKKNLSGRGNWKSKNKGEGSSKDLEKPNDKE